MQLTQVRDLDSADDAQARASNVIIVSVQSPARAVTWLNSILLRGKLIELLVFLFVICHLYLYVVRLVVPLTEQYHG